MKVAGGWGKLHNKELNNLHLSRNIISVMKSRRLRLARHIARTDTMRVSYEILIRKPEERALQIEEWMRR
jgi:hypothetical protein